MSSYVVFQLRLSSYSVFHPYRFVAVNVVTESGFLGQSGTLHVPLGAMVL